MSELDSTSLEVNVLYGRPDPLQLPQTTDQDITLAGDDRPQEGVLHTALECGRYFDTEIKKSDNSHDMAYNKLQHSHSRTPISIDHHQENMLCHYSLLGPDKRESATDHMEYNALYSNPNRAHFDSQLQSHHTPSQSEEGSSARCQQLILIAAIIVIALYSLLCTLAFAVAFVQISELRSVQQSSFLAARIAVLNNTLNQIETQLEQNMNEALILSALLNDSYTTFHQRLSELRDSTVGVVEGVSMRTVGASFNPASSCAALPPSLPSGYYWVGGSEGPAERVYCEV